MFFPPGNDKLDCILTIFYKKTPTTKSVVTRQPIIGDISQWNNYKVTRGITSPATFVVYAYEIGSEFMSLIASNDGVVLS